MNHFSDLIGYAEEKIELERICDILKNTEKYRALGVSAPKGLLIDGKPGLGKTLAAQDLAKASERKVFCCRKDKSDGDFVNEIRETFEKAKAETPSIVFLDDMDKFANEDERHRNAEEFVTVQSCIDGCKDLDVFVLATANETHCLPASLLRAGRFDKILTFTSPKFEDAVEIVRFYLGKKKFVAEVDVEEITRILSGRSCAELETVINEAGILAGFANKTRIDMDDIVKACLRVIFNAPESVNTDSSCVKKVAYHEAGHALVQDILEPGSVNLVSVAAYSGSIGGVASCSQAENYFKEKKYMENRVKCILAGRAATELVFGTTDVGAGSDLRRAFSIVERFVDNYCSYGFWMFSDNSVGTEVANRKDFALSMEMERYYSETKRIIIENREYLEKIVEALLEKKTLLRKDLAEIRAAVTAAA